MICFSSAWEFVSSVMSSRNGPMVSWVMIQIGSRDATTQFLSYSTCDFFSDPRPTQAPVYSSESQKNLISTSVCSHWNVQLVIQGGW
jgi:hypothetical protein